MKLTLPKRTKRPLKPPPNLATKVWRTGYNKFLWLPCSQFKGANCEGVAEGWRGTNVQAAAATPAGGGGWLIALGRRRAVKATTPAAPPAAVTTDDLGQAEQDTTGRCSTRFSNKARYWRLQGMGRPCWKPSRSKIGSTKHPLMRWMNRTSKWTGTSGEPQARSCLQSRCPNQHQHLKGSEGQGLTGFEGWRVRGSEVSQRVKRWEGRGLDGWRVRGLKG